MNKISIKGVLLGGIADVGGTFALGIPLVIFVASRLDLSKIPSGQQGAAVTAAISASSPFSAAQVAIGFGCSLLGGYLAGRIAKHDQVLNGALSSFLSTAIGIYSLASGHDTHSRVVQVLFFFAAPALGLLGGYLSTPEPSRIIDEPAS